MKTGLLVGPFGRVMDSTMDIAGKVVDIILPEMIDAGCPAVNSELTVYRCASGDSVTQQANEQKAGKAGIARMIAAHHHPPGNSVQRRPGGHYFWLADGRRQCASRLANTNIV